MTQIALFNFGDSQCESKYDRQKWMNILNELDLRPRSSLSLVFYATRVSLVASKD